MIILSIDPGIANTGYALIDFDKFYLLNYGIIHTYKSKGDPDYIRAKQIADKLLPSTPVPDVILVEAFHSYRSRSNAEKTIYVIQALFDRFVYSKALEESRFMLINHTSWSSKKKKLTPLFDKLTKEVEFGKSDHIQDAIYQGLAWYYHLRK